MQSEPVQMMSQDKGEGFRGGIATHLGKTLLSTEPMQHFPSSMKRKEKEGGEKVGNLR